MEDSTILIGTWFIVFLILLFSWLFLEEVKFDVSRSMKETPFSDDYFSSTPSPVTTQTPSDGSSSNGGVTQVEETNQTGEEGTVSSGTGGTTPAPTTGTTPAPTTGTTPAPTNGSGREINVDPRRVPDDQLVSQVTYDRSASLVYPSKPADSPRWFSDIQVDSAIGGRINMNTVANINAAGGFPSVPGYNTCPEGGELKTAYDKYYLIRGAAVSPVESKTNLNQVASDCDADADCLAFSVDALGKGRIFKANDKASEILDRPNDGEKELYKHRPLYIKDYPNLNVKGMRECAYGTKFYPQIMS